MIDFCCKDINCVYLSLLELALREDVGFTDSRVGAVRDLGPAVLEFSQPQHQLLFLRGRKYNPFFSMIESCWILSGRDTLADLKSVVSGYSKFSDDGVTLNGAYGFRMRHYFEIDQVKEVVSILRDNPDSRRAVISLYGAKDLVNYSSRDIPCNTTVFIKVRNGALDLTVINRSNDLFLGVPYNIFVFGVLQKFIANELSLPLGVQRHFTDSLHLYEENISAVNDLVRINNQSEIDSWVRKYPSDPEFFPGIFSDSEAISKMDLENIQSNYCRNVVDAFIQRKNRGDSELVENLPADAFGHAARLWLESL